MAFQVITFCSYCNARMGYAHQDTFHAGKFVKAIKGDGVNGWAEVPVPIDGARRRLTQENCGDVIGWFAEMAEAFVPKGELVFVPIPGCKATTIAEVRTGAAFRMARALAVRRPAKVETLLRWRQPMQSSRRGGTRASEVLLQNLVVDGPPSGHVVLIDDVCASGGHLRAAEAALRTVGGQVLAALCAGQAESFELESAFEVRRRDLEPC